MAETMNALCPCCGGNGCRNCDESGYRPVGVKAGSMWTRHCDECGEDNGGRIEDRTVQPIEALGRCVFCKGGPVTWKYVCET